MPETWQGYMDLSKPLTPITLAVLSLGYNSSYTHSLPTVQQACLCAGWGKWNWEPGKWCCDKQGRPPSPCSRTDAPGQQSLLRVKARLPCKLLLGSGTPIREERGGLPTCVMNSMQEIEQAYRDFQDGQFGPV